MGRARSASCVVPAVLTAALLFLAPARAQTPPAGAPPAAPPPAAPPPQTPAAPAMAGQSAEGDGMVVRVESGNLVWIDKGQQAGLARGDVFDIISSEVLVHPLTDSIMAVTPKTVGALRVLQVFPRTALAELVNLDRGEDPMLKPIQRVRDPERLAEIEQQLMHGMRAAAGMDVSLRVAVIPGLYQLQIGEIRKGWGLLGAEAVSLVAGIAYRSNSNDWYDQYKNLPAGLPESDYDRYFTKAQDLRTRSNRLFWLAGALYLYNWVDVLWMGGGAQMVPMAAGPGVHIEIGHAAAGWPRLQVTGRF